MTRFATAAAVVLALIAAGAALAQVRGVAPAAPNNLNLTLAPVSPVEFAAVRNELKQARTELAQTRTEMAQLRALYLAHAHTYPRGDDGHCAQTKPAAAATDNVSIVQPQAFGAGPCKTSAPVN